MSVKSFAIGGPFHDVECSPNNILFRGAGALRVETESAIWGIKTSFSQISSADFQLTLFRSFHSLDRTIPLPHTSTMTEHPRRAVGVGDKNVEHSVGTVNHGHDDHEEQSDGSRLTPFMSTSWG